MWHKKKMPFGDVDDDQEPKLLPTIRHATKGKKIKTTALREGKPLIPTDGRDSGGNQGEAETAPSPRTQEGKPTWQEPSSSPARGKLPPWGMRADKKYVDFQKKQEKEKRGRKDAKKHRAKKIQAE